MTVLDLTSPTVRTAEAAVREVVDSNKRLSSLEPSPSCDDDWVSFTIRDRKLLNRDMPRASFDALLASNSLAGSTRWCLGGGELRLRADLPLRGVSDDRVVIGIQHMALSITLAAGRAAPVLSNTPADDDDLNLVLDTVASEFGWSASTRNDQVTVFELATMGRGGHAQLERGPNGYRLSTSLVRESIHVGTPTLDATATFLLHCSNHIRGCRAAANENEFLGFEVCFPFGVTDVELHHGLSALSVAVSRSRSEVATLIANEHVARAYIDSTYGFPRKTRKRQRAGGQSAKR